MRFTIPAMILAFIAANFVAISPSFSQTSGSTEVGKSRSTPGVGQRNLLETILARKLIRVAVQKSFPPFTVAVAGSTDLKGYDVSFAKMLAVDLGVKLELVPVAGPDRIPYLQQGKVDVIIASLGKNPDREKQIDFSVPYAPFYVAVFGPKEDLLSSPTDFKLGRIGVTKASIEETELARLKVPTQTIDVFADNGATLDAYRSGQVRYIATGNTTIAQLSITEASRVGLKLLLRDSPCFVGIPKGETALTERINAYIKRAKDYHYLQSNVQQWFKVPLPDNML